MADTSNHKRTDWNQVLAIAGGAASGAAGANEFYNAQQSASSAIAETNWPLILGVGAAGLGLVYIATNRRR